MGQTGNRGSQEAISPEEDGKDKDTPTTTLTSRLLSIVNDLRFPLPLRSNRDSSPSPGSRTPKVQTPMRFFGSDFRVSQSTSKVGDVEETQRAATLPTSIRTCLTLPDDALSNRSGVELEMSTLRPKCTCFTHKTVCLVGELRRFRQHLGGEPSEPLCSPEAECNCGEVCVVHPKSSDAMYVDNIELAANDELPEAALDSFELPKPSDEDFDLYCDSDTLRLTDSLPRSDGSSAPPKVIPDEPAVDDKLDPEQGYLRIILNLTQPINVVAGTRPPSIFDVIQHKMRTTTGIDVDSMDNRTLTSFYMPRGTVKIIHIAKDTTAQDVIAALLRRFRVVDSPKKFALYGRQLEEGVESTRVKMRRMTDDELPLSLGTERQIVLQENDNQDVEWDAFTIPELSNFLVILNREEDEYRRRVRMRYRVHQKKILERMEFLRPGSTANRYDYVLDDLKASKTPAF